MLLWLLKSQKTSWLNWSIDFCSYLCAVPIRILLNSLNGEWKCFWKHTQKLLNKGQNKWRVSHCQKKFQKVNRTFQHFLKCKHVWHGLTENKSNTKTIYKVYFPITLEEEHKHFASQTLFLNNLQYSSNIIYSKS